MTQDAAPGWYPDPEQANTLRYFDGNEGGERIAAPGLQLLEQMAADVRVIRTAALLWMTLTIIGLIAAAVIVLSNS